MAKILSAKKEDVFFIQIGAMDGKTQDPIYELIQNYKWQGVLVEPTKEHFQTLKNNYQNFTGLQFENSAITNEDGNDKIYKVPKKIIQEKNLPHWLLQAATFFPQKTAMNWQEFESEIVAETVQTKTLKTLLQEYKIDHLDVLQIDAEGYDYQILKQLDFKKYRPFVINLEIVNLNKSEVGECKALLDKNDYVYCKNGYDLLAVAIKKQGKTGLLG